MKYLLITKFNVNHFLFLSYLVLTFIFKLIGYYINSTDDISATFHSYYIASLSDFLSIIPFLIIKIRSQSSRVSDIKRINTQKSYNSELLIYNDISIDNSNKRGTKFFKLLFICSVFDFAAQYINVIFSIIIKTSNYPFKEFNLNFVLIIHIIVQYLLSYIILHYRFYKHHYFSLFINLIFLIALVILDIIQIKKTDISGISLFVFILIKILAIIFYSVEDTIAKIILTYNSISPYIFLFCRAFIVNLLVLIFSVIFIFVYLPDEKGENSCVFTRFWKLYEDKTNIICYIFLLIESYLYNLNIFFVIDKFSSNHLAMTTIIGHFGYLLYSFIIPKDIDIKEFFPRVTLYIILIIAASIHNEFIVLKFCKLERQTKLFLEIEAESDIKQTELDIGINENNDILDISEQEKEGIDIELVKVLDN